LIYPSLFDGFGLAILEAIASGCRVLCSYTSSFPEVFIDFVEYFDPGDLQSLRRAMENVLQNNNTGEDWRIRAHAHALEYTWEKVGHLTVNEYLKVLD
jgi:alpha-1,3-rhamnosyl/mannosyltransferase